MRLIHQILGTVLLVLSSAADAADRWAKETNTLLGVTVGKPVPALTLCSEDDDDKAKCADGDGQIKNGPDLGFQYVLHYEEESGLVTNVTVAAAGSEYDQMAKLAVIRFGKPTVMSGKSLTWLGKTSTLRLNQLRDIVVMSLHDNRTLDLLAKERRQMEQDAASKF